MPPNEFNQNNVTSPTFTNTNITPSNIQQPMQQPIQNTAPVYAGFWVRFAAMVVDTVIFQTIFIILVIILVVFVPSVIENELIKNVIIGVYGLCFFLYYVLTQSGAHQATIGKRLAGLRVVRSTDMSRISIGRSIGRELAKIISYAMFMIGFIMAGFTTKKQGLHDMMAGTVVVKERPSRTGLMLLIIFGPVILEIVAIVVFGAMFMSALLGSVVEADFNNDMQIEEPSNLISENIDNKPTATIDPSIEPMSVENYDHALDFMNMRDFEVESPGAYVGPAIIEFHGDAGVNNEIEIFLPELPNIEKTKVVITLYNIYSNKGIDVFDSNSAFEKGDFTVVEVSKQTNNSGDVYYEGYRTVHYIKGKELDGNTFGMAKGTLTLKLPFPDGTTYDKEYRFTINNK